VVRFAILVLAGCGRIGFGTAGSADASGGGDTPVDAPLGLFGTPVAVLPVGGTDDDPSLPDSMLEMYFERNGDIFVATRLTKTAAFGTPTMVAELSSGSTETTPEITLDGTMIYFASDRPGGSGNTDLYFSVRSGMIWGAPERIPELSSAAADTAGNATDTDIYFDSTRNGGFDVFHATRSGVGQAWSSIELVNVSSPNALDGSAFATGDGLALYFDSDRTGIVDLFVATRSTTAEPFGAPMPIAEINEVASAENDAWVSPDGRHLFFASDRDGSLRIYEATR
jgi:hypothetical protein